MHFVILVLEMRYLLPLSKVVFLLWRFNLTRTINETSPLCHETLKKLKVKLVILRTCSLYREFFDNIFNQETSKATTDKTRSCDDFG